MDIRKLQRIVVGALEDIKARDIEVINTRTASPLFDRVIIASADSSRQTRALARHVCDKVKAAGGDVRSVEGEETGEEESVWGIESDAKDYLEETARELAEGLAENIRKVSDYRREGRIVRDAMIDSRSV